MTRPLSLLLTLVFSLGALSAIAAAEENPKPVKHLIDTHIYLYDTTCDLPMSWPPKDDAVLYQPHLPAEYSKVA